MVRGLPSFSSQCAAQYPYQKSQQKIDGSHEKVEGVFVDESVKAIQRRCFQFEGFNLPGLHDVLLMPRRSASLVRFHGFRLWLFVAVRIRSTMAFPPRPCA